MKAEMAKGAKEAAGVKAKYEETMEQLKKLQQRSDREKNEHIQRLEMLDRRIKDMEDKQRADDELAKLRLQRDNEEDSGIGGFLTSVTSVLHQFLGIFNVLKSFKK
jgi:predicted DNA-binding protein